MDMDTDADADMDVGVGQRVVKGACWTRAEQKRNV